MHEIALRIAGETLCLMGDRALFWPARRRLLIADLHLGKADTFRAAGIALPRGGTAHDLARLDALLDALLDATGAESLWILGDMLHGALVDSAWRAEWTAFRARRATLSIVVVAGNHDRALAEAGLELIVHARAIEDGPFVFAHMPLRSAQSFAISGHRHPVVRVPGFGGRFPCFDIEPHSLVLPAFSAFTGGHLLERPDGWVACVGGFVVPSLGAAVDRRTL